MKSVVKTVDLFCGAGGMSLGFQKAGFQIVLAVDNWNVAVDCYKRNFAHQVEQLDLHNVDAVSTRVAKAKPDIIIGGPPCQDFSGAGSRKEGSRAQLTSDFAAIVAKCSPKYFVMENVERARLSNAYATARNIFLNAGYRLTEIVLDACFCGVPQHRKRFFCIGGKNESDEFLEKILVACQSDVAMSLRDYFADKLPFEFYYQHPLNYSRRGVFSVDEPSVTIRGATRPMPKRYKRHHLDAAAPHRNGIRAFTVAERAAIQMFPTRYQWSDSATANNQMIGNAVPVGLAQFVAEALMYYIKNKRSLRIPLTFMEWLQRDKHLHFPVTRDILSRYRRARKMLGKCYQSDAILVNQLQRSDSFEAIPKMVQGQLLHACQLHAEYLTFLAGQETKKTRPLLKQRMRMCR